ncbi:MAG: M20 family metallopeptidase [Candidatus Saccharimonadales bacterium]
MPRSNEAASLQSQTDFLSQLVQISPLYEDFSAQRNAALAIADRLEIFGWDEVALQRFSAWDLRDDPQYIDVSSFGGEYDADLDRPKNNVVGILRSGKPGKTVILNGHFDVEPVTDKERWTVDGNSGRVVDGNLWGRGSTDMLGGLSSQLYVASRLAADRNNWAGQIIFTAVTDEEIGGNGTLAVLKKLSEEGHLDTDEEISCLIAEPSEGVIALESLGFMLMNLRTRGNVGHLAGAEKSDSAIYPMLEAVDDLETILRTSAQNIFPDSDGLPFNIGSLNGGFDAATTMSSLVAESVVFYSVDIGANALRESISAEISKRAGGLEVEFPDLSFDGHRSSYGDLARALVTSRPNPLIETGIFPSPCDARLFGPFGIDNVVIYGPGSIKQAHAVDEHISIGDIDQYNTHLEAALRQYLAG